MAVPEAINGPQLIGNANNLSSVFQHPDIIDDSLKKEEEIRCIIGSYTSPTFFPAHPNVCHQNLFQMLFPCGRIVAPFKTEWVKVPTICLTFLGIVF